MLSTHPATAFSAYLRILLYIRQSLPEYGTHNKSKDYAAQYCQTWGCVLSALGPEIEEYRKSYTSQPANLRASREAIHGDTRWLFRRLYIC